MIRVTWEVPPVTEEILPASPSAAMTGSLRAMPSELPLLMPMVEYQTVGERVITRAVTSVAPAVKLASLVSPTRACSWAESRSAVWPWAACSRSCATCFLSSLFSFLALKTSPVQPARLRIGLKARLTPFSSGEKAVSVPRENACSEPLPDSPK